MTTEPADDWCDLAPCGLMLTDSSGTILRANAQFCQSLGYRALPQPGAPTFQSLLSMGGRMFHQTHWQPLLEMQSAVMEVKFDFLHVEGHRVPMVINARVLTLESGQVVHSIAAFAATDRDRYEQALLKAKSEAESLLRERTDLEQQASERSLFAEQLIGIVSHDMRNPLTAIRMGTEMLVMKDSDPGQLKIAERINQSVDRALALIEDMLDFTLTKTGRSLDVERVAIDLHDVADAAIEELRWSFPRITLTHVSEGDGLVWGDSSRLTRVIGNLVANAYRYGDSSHPVTVTTRVHGGRVRLDVHNMGPPIAPSLIPLLFKAMSRGSSSHGGGVGLGLYIVSQIAAAHDGTPYITSTAEDGTRIGIEFPLKPALTAV